MAAVYKMAAVRKIKGDGISIYSYINRSNIKVIRKAFKGEVVIKRVLDY
jgi:2-polyprenyl-3-methyl-5-hydroxy-6-metoxy-1,4-benzoquinol methylase